MWFRYSELSQVQQQQARARFIDAGTVRDRYWYEVGFDGNVVCRNRDPGEICDHEYLSEDGERTAAMVEAVFYESDND